MEEFGEKHVLKLSRPAPSCAPELNQGSLRFIVDAKRRLVITRFGERLNAADIQSYAQNLRTHPGFDSSFSEIVDIREVKELPLEAADFLKLADQIDPFSFESRRAFVAQTSIQKHAARMHKILRGQRNFGIFETLKEAEDWITGNGKRSVL